VTGKPGYEEERLGRLLGLAGPVPAGWVRAAQELPAARASLDELVARAQADEAVRAAVVADLESALRGAGVEPRRPLVEELRRRLAER
jgi:hypothetical protein